MLLHSSNIFKHLICLFIKNFMLDMRYNNIAIFMVFKNRFSISAIFKFSTHEMNIRLKIAKFNACDIQNV